MKKIVQEKKVIKFISLIYLLKTLLFLYFIMSNIINKKKLYESINSLTSIEHEEILKILQKHNIFYSKNNNGIFFNLSTLQDDIINELDNFISFCLLNKTKLDEYDKKLNQCKIENNFTGLIKEEHYNLSVMMNKNNIKTINENIIVDDKNMERFLKFVENVNKHKEKISKKNFNMKYNNARKLYSKKYISDSLKKFENESYDILDKDSYLII